MRERLIDIVAVPDHSGIARWQAVVPPGFVAGVADLRPVIPFEHGLFEVALDIQPGAVELNLYVEPQWRRRGIGSLLLAAVGEHAVQQRLVAEVAAGSAGEAFCVRHGFRHTGSRCHDLLSYGDVHQAWLAELVDVGHAGYRLSHWTGDLSDATQVEELLRHPSRPGSAVLSAAEADGDLVAYAVAAVDAMSQRRARQYGPSVLAAHRGRRLGLWVNAALIKRLREVHPHIDEIEARTAEDDLGLLALRRHLGFHHLRRTRVYELALP
ncbi:GNAT family N-acetyltransferase [Micromonospora krabiensis]|uniref:Acetyltransferase (GNAT) family protein n=1 Tax=Micromonospora krabiensis TaxID=307121 RepID=A0A1C3MWD1_9ACTN|nr:GNAT family N-acetyltransferase [Micromonospora krabiensis]SBV24631.1 Acetyltransferase (GNAT) family protein [Micromonospora krabiensis]